MSEGAESRQAASREAHELAEQYLAFLADVRRVSPQSVRAYESDLRAFLGWCEREGITPLEATRRHMRSYLAYMKSSGYADKTINRRVSSLRTFYAWIEREGRGSAEATAAMKGRKLSKTLPNNS